MAIGNSSDSKTPEMAAGRSSPLDCTSEGSMMLQNLARGRRAEGRGGGEKEMGRTVRRRGERVSAFQVLYSDLTIFLSPNLSRTLSENAAVLQICVPGTTKRHRRMQTCLLYISFRFELFLMSSAQ